MAFKMKSGNRPLFKKIGASPLKAFPVDKQPVSSGGELPEVTISDKKNHSTANTQASRQLPEVEIKGKKTKKKPPIEEEPKKKPPKKEEPKKEVKSKDKSRLTAALEKQNELRRRKEKREKYMEKTKNIINLLDKDGI